MTYSNKSKYDFLGKKRLSKSMELLVMKLLLIWLKKLVINQNLKIVSIACTGLLRNHLVQSKNQQGVVFIAASYKKN